jgi:hypothetical protein
MNRTNADDWIIAMIVGVLALALIAASIYTVTS